MRSHALALLLLVLITSATAQTATPQKGPTSQRVPGAQNGEQAPKTPEAIVNFLTPDDVAYVERLGLVPPAQAIAALKQAQPRAGNTQADAIAFLLVLLGSDTEANRSHLLNSLGTCTREPAMCDERAINYLGALYEHGDTDVLEPLLEASRNSDGIVLEEVASAYDDMIVHDAHTFITAVAKRPAKEQKRLCALVASGDGVGLTDDAEIGVVGALNEIAGESGPLAATARLCMNEIKAAK